jgi:hypothetical protein
LVSSRVPAAWDPDEAGVEPPPLGPERMVENRGLFGIRAIGHSASIQNAPTSKPRAWRTRRERPWSLPAPSRATMSGIITVDCPIVAETPVGRLGLAVCYDLDNVRRQFPVLAHRVDCE